jgi:hypothetical protein
MGKFAFKKNVVVKFIIKGFVLRDLRRAFTRNVEFLLVF